MNIKELIREEFIKENSQKIDFDNVKLSYIVDLTSHAIYLVFLSNSKDLDKLKSKEFISKFQKYLSKKLGINIIHDTTHPAAGIVFKLSKYDLMNILSKLL